MIHDRLTFFRIFCRLLLFLFNRAGFKLELRIRFKYLVLW